MESGESSASFWSLLRSSSVCTGDAQLTEKHLPDISKGMIPHVPGKVVKCWLQSDLVQSVSIRASFHA